MESPGPRVSSTNIVGSLIPKTAGARDIAVSGGVEASLIDYVQEAGRPSMCILSRMSSLPIELARDTILECVFEARFGASAPSAVDLLPGMIFGSLRDTFKSSLKLPLGQFPSAIRDQNPQFRYAPTHMLEGPNIRMLFGPNSAAVSFPKPYAGWGKVHPKIIQCMGAVFDAQLMGRPERFSIKYVNLLQAGIDEFDLKQTTLQLSLGTFALRREGVVVKAEIIMNDCVSIVEMATGANIVMPGFPQENGVLVSVDTIHEIGEGDFRATLPQTLETLHDTEKEVFFGLLAPSVLEKLGPRYAKQH